MYTLYYSPFSCSLAVHMALKKIDSDFKLEKIDVRKDMHNQPDFLKINKHGKVPVLKDADQLVDQGGSILLYLADKHPQVNLLPAIADPARADAISTLFYMSNTVHPTFAMLFYPDRFTQGEASDVFNNAAIKIMEILTELNQTLAHKDFLCGEQVYVADYYLRTMLNWTQLFKISLDDYPNLMTYKNRMDKLTEVIQAIAYEMTVF